MIFGQSNQKKRNKIIKNAQNAVVTGRMAEKEIKRLIKKGKPVTGINKLRNTTKKSINSINNHLKSKLFNPVNAPANHRTLSNLRSKQTNVLASLQPVQINILKNKKQYMKNLKRLDNELQKREIQNLNRRLARLKA